MEDRPGPVTRAALPAGSGAHVVVIGEAMVELSRVDIAAGRATVGVAGDTLNTAIYLARALRGAGTVDYVTALGRESLSDAMVARIASEGVGTGRIGRHPSRLPGIYAIETDAAGERSFRYWRETSAARTLFSEPGAAEAAIAGADVVYLSGITLAILSEAARASLVAACTVAGESGRIVVFDSNFRPALWPDRDAARAACDAMWRAATVALPSADDEAALHPGESPEAAVRRIAGHGVAEIVLKCGARGPLVWEGGPCRAAEPRAAMRVVDTTAAGDSFNAGYMAARLRGAAPLAAAREGHALAACVIARPGAILPGCP